MLFVAWTSFFVGVTHGKFWAEESVAVRSYTLDEGRNYWRPREDRETRQGRYGRTSNK
jgi:hypothetical protein